MDILIDIYNENELKDILDIVPELKIIDNKEVIAKINILLKIGLNELEIKNIIYENPRYLSNDDILPFISYFKEFNLKELIISYPLILNYTIKEIDNILKEKQITKEDLINNPLLIEEEYYE